MAEPEEQGEGGKLEGKRMPISNRNYRVYHIEMDETKGLWGVDESSILLNYGA